MAVTVSLRDYERAERELMRTEARQGYRIHATVYVVVNLLLLASNLLVISITDTDMIWFVFPLVGWGIGLAMHYVFGIRRLETHITDWQGQIERRAGAA